MRNVLIFICFAAFSWFAGQACKSAPAYPSTSEVKYVNNPSQGLVTVEAIGYGKTEAAAELDAFNTAFTTIFFKGLPGFTALRTPMIPDESKARSEHSAYFKKFFDDRGYLQFITNQGGATKAGKADDNRSRMARRTFTINYESLRRDLEQKGVIRKFGL